MEVKEEAKAVEKAEEAVRKEASRKRGSRRRRRWWTWWREPSQAIWGYGPSASAARWPSMRETVCVHEDCVYVQLS